jgi:hypothetical protein
MAYVCKKIHFNKRASGKAKHGRRANKAGGLGETGRLTRQIGRSIDEPTLTVKIFFAAATNNKTGGIHH